MMKNVLPRTLALGLSLAPLALASAQSAPPSYVFTAVDSVELRENGFEFQVTGVLQGQNTPQTVKLISTFIVGGYDSNNASDRCERMALLAMNKPGRYLFEVQQEDSGYRCKLTRLP